MSTPPHPADLQALLGKQAIYGAPVRYCRVSIGLKRRYPIPVPRLLARRWLVARHGRGVRPGHRLRQEHVRAPFDPRLDQRDGRDGGGRVGCGVVHHRVPREPRDEEHLVGVVGPDGPSYKLFLSPTAPVPAGGST